MGLVIYRPDCRLRSGERSVAVPVGGVTVQHRHRHVAAWKRRQTSLDADHLLVLGGSGVVLFDGEFFARVLSVNPVLGERG